MLKLYQCVTVGHLIAIPTCTKLSYVSDLFFRMNFDFGFWGLMTLGFDLVASKSQMELFVNLELFTTFYSRITMAIFWPTVRSRPMP